VISTWLLLIALTIPSFGGPVTIMVRTHTKEGCEKFRSMTKKQFSELLIPDTGLGKCVEVKGNE